MHSKADPPLLHVKRLAWRSSIVVRERDHPPNDVKAAKAARLLQERLFYPSDYNLVKSLTHGSFTNCRVTPKAIKLAKAIYGISEAVLAGKTKKQSAVSSVEIPVPTHMERDQILYLDMFYWRSEKKDKNFLCVAYRRLYRSFFYQSRLS